MGPTRCSTPAGTGAARETATTRAPTPTTGYSATPTSTTGSLDSLEDSPLPPSKAPGDKSQKSPKDFLKAIKGRHVSVKLNHGAEYKGVLACLDGYMNIAMEQTEEYVDGQLKAKYGDAFIRGNNVLYISTQKPKR